MDSCVIVAITCAKVRKNAESKGQRMKKISCGYCLFDLRQKEIGYVFCVANLLYLSYYVVLSFRASGLQRQSMLLVASVPKL